MEKPANEKTVNVEIKLLIGFRSTVNQSGGKRNFSSYFFSFFSFSFLFSIRFLSLVMAMGARTFASTKIKNQMKMKTKKNEASGWVFFRRVRLYRVLPSFSQSNQFFSKLTIDYFA